MFRKSFSERTYYKTKDEAEQHRTKKGGTPCYYYKAGKGWYMIGSEDNGI